MGDDAEAIPSKLATLFGAFISVTNWAPTTFYIWNRGSWEFKHAEPVDASLFTTNKYAHSFVHGPLEILRFPARRTSTKLSFTMKNMFTNKFAADAISHAKKTYAAAFLSVEHVLNSSNFERLFFGRGATS